VRAGAFALTLLSAPLHVHVLQALGDEARPLADLQRAAGSPPQTTMRGHLRTLTQLEVVERRQQTPFPGAVEYELTRKGRDLVAVAAVLRRWLSLAPHGSIELGSAEAKSAVRALVAGWDARVVRALAARPLALTELSRLISELSYPSLERRLGAMRLAGQIERLPNGERGTPYQATTWLRQAMVPLTLAARWERSHVPDKTTAISKMDVESVFLLTVPTLSARDDFSGRCRLAVESRNDRTHNLAGVVTTLDHGEVVACTSRLQGEVEASATGSAASWLRAVFDGEDCLDLGGETALALALVDALRNGLVLA
jgi:DNA-binding HxlR family transcriptional regulator